MELHKDLQIPRNEIASNTFRDENYLGGGGFGQVFKGELSRFKEQGMVAFKKLDRVYGQGETEFFKEIEMLSKYKHENIITLLGYCMEGKDLILVYEYASNGSLDSCLNSPHLTWPLRLKICLQAAKGLRYLHDPKESHLRVIHRDIKSANILLDDKWNAKVSDFGLSKISHENANVVTYLTGTTGYLDPQYPKTYTITEKSDVYSFGVTLFEVLCGKLCYEIIGNNDLLVFVHKWMESCEQNILKDIIFKELDMKQMDPSSIKIFSDIAYKCLKESREERPTMAEVVSQLEVALQAQERYEVFLKHPLAKEYDEILRTAVYPVIYSSIEELKQRLSQWVLINGGHTLLSLTEMGAHHLRISIEDCYLSLDDLNRDESDQDWSTESVRFKASCYKTRLMKFKLLIRTTSFLTPDITYGAFLIFRCSDFEDIHVDVGVTYQLNGEPKISIVRSSNEDREMLKVELYQFTNKKESIQDFKILFQDCGLSGWLYIEGIEFRPLKKVESPMEVANKEIVRTLEPPLFYNYNEELKAFLSRGILLSEGKMWLSLNEKGEHHLMMSIKDCLTGDCCNEFWAIEKSRFKVGCCKTDFKDFKLHLTTPLFLSPDVTYMVNLVIHYSEGVDIIEERNIGVRFKILGETKISILRYEEKREGNWLVAELYQYTCCKESTLDLEILLENSGLELEGDCYIEGIEFRPLEKAEIAVVEANEDIIGAALSPQLCKFTEEAKVLLSQGILLEEGKMWLSSNEKGEHHVAISIKAFCRLHTYSEINISRFPVGYCMIEYFNNVKLHVKNPLFLSPNVTYRLNLVFRCSEKEKNKQQYVGVRYKIEGETKLSVLQYDDKREGKWLVAELYQYTSYKDSTLDLEILFENPGLVGEFYIEGIEFLPLEKAESVLVEANQEIVTAAVYPFFNKFTEEVLRSDHMCLDKGNTRLSLNENGALFLKASVKDYLMGDYHDKLCSECGYSDCEEKSLMKSKLHVTTPMFLSLDVRYGINLLIYYAESEKIKQKHVGFRYLIQGETKISILQFHGKEKGNWLVAELCQFTNYKDSTLDLELLLEDCGLAGKFHIIDIHFRPLGKVESAGVVANEEIVTAAVPPLFHEFKKLPEVLHSQGVLLNEGKTLVLVNDKGQNIERIEIGACLNGISKYPFDYSRFSVYEYKDEFKASVRAEYLTPQTSYTLKLYFKVEEDVNGYALLRYKLDGEQTKIFVNYPTDTREEGFFLAPICQFTSQCETLNLDIMFEQRIAKVQVAAIQLYPSEEKVDLQVFEEYHDIVKVASQSLIYRSREELTQILSIGVHLNRYRTWFSINKKGEHCEMISMKDCLIPIEDYSDRFKSHPSSRFPAGVFETNGEPFKTHVKTQFLSPKIKYTIYLVFSSSSITKQAYVGLKYRLRGETTSIVYVANPREEDDLCMAELFRFTSNGNIFDLEIDFDGHEEYIGIEGILFQPLEEVEDQPLEDSDSDNWEEKIPNDYKEILKLSRVQWTTKKELYVILCKGLLLDKGQQWFTIDKNGKKCPMFRARESLVVFDKRNSTWESLQQSRFGEVLVITGDGKFKLWQRIEFKDVSPETRYACYLVYRLPLDQSTFEAPLLVNLNRGHAQNAWFVYLSPPNCPIIGQNLDENTCSPLNIYKGVGIPQQRSDGWMEVKVWEFQTQDTGKAFHINLKLARLKNKDLIGLMVQGIELRPI